MSRIKILALLLCLVGAGTASAKAPAAPTDLKVKVLGVNSFKLSWEDHSKNELGWEIRVSLGKTAAPKRFQLVPTANLTSFVVLTNELPGKTLSIQVAAYNGKPGFEKISKPTKVVTVTALPEKTFAIPKALEARALDDGRIKISWKDKSTSEYGYQVEMKKSVGDWILLGNVGPDIANKFTQSGLDPATAYYFRVRGFKYAPGLEVTGYSKTVTATTRPFQAPSNLEAFPEKDGKLSFKWNDRSSSEGGFEIESKTGTADFSKLSDIAPNSTNIDPSNFGFDQAYQFRLRAFRIVNGLRVFTGYSNVASAKTTGIAAPTGLAAVATGDTSVGLTWTDVSTREYGYQVRYREVGTTVDHDINLGSDSKSYTITGLIPGKQYSFQVRASGFFGLSYSAFSATANVTLKHSVYGNLNPPILAQQKFLYQIQLSNAANLTSLTVTGLPPGLVFNPATRTITGTVTASTPFTATIAAIFNNGTTSTKSLILKPITGAPEVTKAFTNVSVAVAATKNVPLAGKFADPDTQSAARVVTSKGNFDIILYPDSTPVTTNNFLDYVDDGRYNNTFFHRAPLNFVVQGGGYAHTTAKGFYSVEKFAQIPNEPGLPNIRGTVAMAKLGGQPDSASSEFFVNLNDLNGYDPNNPPPGLPNLDTQNGGFTVFGRVAAPGMALLDSINQLPRGNYTVTIGGESVALGDVPVDAATAPVNIDPAKLVKITSVIAAPILTYQVLSQNTAVATATINGSDIVITGITKGATTITVKATDLDGQTVSQSIAVTVP